MLSKRTTRVLLASFAILLTLSAIGLFSQMNTFATPLDPREDHESHMLVLEPRESESVHMQADTFYSAYMIKGTSVKAENLRLVNESSQEEISAELSVDSIPGGLQGEDGTVFSAVATWVPTTDADVVLYNDANATIWLVNETAVLETILADDLMIGSMFGCLASICMVPVIILWFFINRQNSSDLMVKMAISGAESGEQDLDRGGKMPTTDELYRVIHGSDAEREQVIEGIAARKQTAVEQTSRAIPAPFADRPDQTQSSVPFSKKEDPVAESVVEDVATSSSQPTDFPASEEAGAWKNWDDG